MQDKLELIRTRWWEKTTRKWTNKHQDRQEERKYACEYNRVYHRAETEGRYQRKKGMIIQYLLKTIKKNE